MALPSAVVSRLHPVRADRLDDPLHRAVACLAGKAGGLGAVFLSLRGDVDGQVQVTGRWSDGDLSLHVRRWVLGASTFRQMGWTASDALPADRAADRRVPVGASAARALSGLLCVDGQVLGWLGLFLAGEGTVPSELRGAWAEARDAILAIFGRAGDLPSARTSLLMTRGGSLGSRCARAASWLDVPGIHRALAARVDAFLEGGQSHARSWTWFGDLEIVRLDGPEGSIALVHLQAGQALPLPIQADLSPRQLDVAASAAVGVTIDEIAQTLGIGRETVRTHLKSVYERLEVANRLELGRLLKATWPVR